MDSKVIVVACCNDDKTAEIIGLLKKQGIDAISAKDPSLKLDCIKKIGKKFNESAALMAQDIAKNTGLLCLAEDSGLEVRQLNGRPGIYPQAYLKYNDYVRAMDKVIAELDELDCFGEDRKARFICVLALAFPPKNGRQTVEFFEGKINGLVPRLITTEYGIGFEPIFIPNGQPFSLSEMDAKMREKVSHRAKAIKKLVDFLKTKKI